MASENENEIRLLIEDSETIQNFLEKKCGQPSPYAFTDHMYYPKGEKYKNDGHFTLCIREWHYGNDNTSFQIKYALKKYSDGQKSQKFGFKLAVASLEIAKDVMASLNMKMVFSFRRDSLHYKDNQSGVDYFLENVEHVGWALELEAPDKLKSLVQQLEKDLGRKFEVLDKSTPTYVWKKIMK